VEGFSRLYNGSSRLDYMLVDYIKGQVDYMTKAFNKNSKIHKNSQILHMSLSNQNSV